MNSEFAQSETQLNSVVFQRQAYTLRQNKVTFRNNRWINFPYMPKLDPGFKYVAFDVSPAFNTIYPVVDAEDLPSGPDDKDPQNSYFSMMFRQSTRTMTTSSTREALSNTFQRFGSYLALCLRFIGYILGAYQRFSLDNSMTKKLYNYVEEDDEPRADPPIPDNTQSFRNDLMSEVKERRKPFKYGMWKFCCKKNFSSPWCLCCRQKDDTLDKLQAKARKRLYSELDIMRIIQRLRVSRFLAETKLSPEQRYLVNYHTEYMLFKNEQGGEPFNASRYDDVRAPNNDAPRDDRLRMTASKAVGQLRHDDEIDRATYVRIMGRNRVDEEPIEQEAQINDQGDDGPDNGAGQPRANFVRDDNNPREGLLPPR